MPDSVQAPTASPVCNGRPPWARPRSKLPAQQSSGTLGLCSRPT